MSAFVLDCSLAVTWFFEDESTAETDALLERLKFDGAIVPNLWHLELANVLTKAERRGRMVSARISAYVGLIDRLPIMTDTETSGRALREILTLARSEDLSTYDAAYLELAIRRGAELATRDRSLIRAAGRFDVVTLPRT